ncbi:MAG: ABC transporter permease, partial [Spirochaetota bacterium]
MKREAVSLLGLTALLFALVFPALTAKPNRAAEGVSVSLWTTPTPEIAVVGLLLVAAIVAAMVLTLVPSRRRLGALRLSVSVAFIPLLLALLGIGSAVALERSGFDAGRTGPGLGWWLGALGAYVLFYDARRRLARNGGATASASGSADHGAVLVRLATPVVLLATVAVFLLVPFDGIGVVQEFLNRGERFWGELGAHLVLSGASVAGAVVIGVPLGMWAFRSKRAVRPVFTVTSGLQTIPSLALFGLMIAPLAFLSREIPALRAIGIRGVGNAPAIIALTLYGLLPVVRNTFVGLKSID